MTQYFFEKFPKINQTELAPTRAPISSQGPTPVPREPNPEDGFQGPTFAAFELKTKPSEPPRWDSGMVGGLTPQEGAPPARYKVVITPANPMKNHGCKWV